MKNALLITTSRRALLRCLALSAMGLHALLYPAGLRGTTALYAAVYLLAFGLLALRDSLTLRGRGRSAQLACGMIAFMMGAAALLWQRSEPRTLPVFFGAFMLMAGAQYLVVGAASRTGALHWPLLTMAGGIALCLLSFTVSASGPLSELLGTLMLMCALCEMQLRQAVWQLRFG